MKLLAIPDSMREQAIDLREICVAELAWEYPMILEVIRYAAGHGHVILGGDVWAIESRGPIATGDNWYIESGDGMSHADLVNLGAARAQQYIEAYHSRNSGRYLYSIVAGLEVDRPSEQ